jgi:ankyrin repeat protein/CRP-like cAMP-binding protein
LLQQIEHEEKEEVHQELMTHLESSSRMKSEVYVGLWGKYLKKYGWFSKFPTHLLGNVCSGCEMMRFSPGDFVVRVGNIGDGMYFVVKGRLTESMENRSTTSALPQLSGIQTGSGAGPKRRSAFAFNTNNQSSTDTSNNDGGLSLSNEPIIIREIGLNEFFGERSLFVPMKWTTQIQCDTYCEILYVPRDKLIEWMNENEEYLMLLRNQRAMVALLAMVGVGSQPTHEMSEIFHQSIREGIDANYIDHENNALVHTAIKAQNFEGVQQLLWRGARTNFTDTATQKYPLQLAIASGDIRIVDVVSEYSDMSNLADGDPCPIADLLQDSGGEMGKVIMFAAAANGYNRVMAFILDKCTNGHGGVNDVYTSPPSGDDEYVVGQKYIGMCLADLAARNGHPDVIDALCDHQADFNACVNERPRLPLHYAVESGQREAVSHLVKHGALTVLRDRDGLTPLDLAIKLESEERDMNRLAARRAISLMLRGLNLHDLSKDGRVDELRSAIADKCDPNIIHPKTGRTPLQYAADANQVGVIKELLASSADIDFTGVSQVTALYSALMKGHMDSTCALLEGGADPNKTLGNGSTPLMAAIKKGSMGLVDVLLKFGARPILDDIKTAFEKKDKAMVVKMKTVISSLGNGTSENGIWTLYIPPSNDSMFHQFCRKGDLAIVNMAIEFNADIVRLNGDGLSPLDVAASAGKDKVVEVLVKTAKTVMGEAVREYMASGLVNACSVPKGTLVSIKMLVALGADMSFRNPLDMAVKSGHMDAIKYFIDSGVDVVSGVRSETFNKLVEKMTLTGIPAPPIAGSTLEILVNAIPSDAIERARREWEVFECAHRAGESGMDEMVNFLCEKFLIDKSIVMVGVVGGVSATKGSKVVVPNATTSSAGVSGVVGGSGSPSSALVDLESGTGSLLKTELLEKKSSNFSGFVTKSIKRMTSSKAGSLLRSFKSSLRKRDD